MTLQAESQTLDFQTEVKQLLHLVIHSLYSNKEIFLRELISNASDAADKLRFEALSNNELLKDDSDLKIWIDIDEKKKTITVRDNAIGMTHDEIIGNLGTIAKSGTREFLSQLTGKAEKDSNLIGQFGVGFYSAFIIADKVTVNSRRAGTPANKAVSWESDGEGQYTIKTIEKPQRGTEIILHLKKDAEEFLSDYRLQSIINKYSEHICWPILMKKAVEATDTDSDRKENVPETFEYQKINSATALWTLNKQEVKEEQYKELYKHISHDFQEPLTWTHNHVEGTQQYISLLYIPSHAPFDLFHHEIRHGLKLYAKRVFIMDEADQFLPRYLRFVKGIIDSSDLPLNISREILQDTKLVETIRKSSIKRILNKLEKMAGNESEKYTTFWKEFGLVFKEGIIEDHGNREQIAKLLRFSSTHIDNEEQSISLDDYLSRMPDTQEKIYYITADSYNTVKNSPHLEIFRKKNIEVILLHDGIDEWLVTHLTEYNGTTLQSITKGELNLGDLKEDEDEKQDDNKDAFESVIKQIKDVLGDTVKEVRVTHRLTNSPACLVADEHDMGREMQRILEAAGQKVPQAKPIFEVNPQHGFLKRLSQETDDTRFTDWTHILYDQAVLAEGGRLDNPATFVQRLNKMLAELT